ncbi:MAG: Gx transporter family protein [Gammaproteobacteria bacterium]|nr:Gx transporter family protein [Gammaproteobacteria bacterium]
MSKQPIKLSIPTTRDDHRIAWLTALAITIHIAEAALPSPLPGVKPGLANVVTLLCLLLYGWRIAAWVAVLRVVVGSLLLGSFLTPTFVLSLSGAAASILVLGFAKQIAGAHLGPVGYSMLAAMTHMAAQFFTAYMFFIPHEGLFHLLPILMTVAIVFGVMSGLIAKQVLDRLEEKT